MAKFRKTKTITVIGIKNSITDRLLDKIKKYIHVREHKSIFFIDFIDIISIDIIIDIISINIIFLYKLFMKFKFYKKLQRYL